METVHEDSAKATGDGNCLDLNGDSTQNGLQDKHMHQLSVRGQKDAGDN